MKHILLGLTILSLFLVGCQSGTVNESASEGGPPTIGATPTADRVYALPQNEATEMASGAVNGYQPESQALMELASQDGEQLTLRPATAEDLEWLNSRNLPESVLDFYTVAEPQQEVESNGVYLNPVRLLRNLNERSALGATLNPHGYVLIATTVGGDGYFVDTTSLDSTGEAPIYIVSHDQVMENASLEDIQANSKLMAVSFQQFLSRFIGQILPYDLDLEEEIFSTSAQRNFFSTYEDNRFNIIYPTSWFRTVDPANPDQVYFVRNSSQATTLGSVVSVAVREGRGSLDEIAQSIIRSVEEQENVTLVQTADQITVNVNGLRGIEQEFEYLVGSETLVQRLVLLQNQERTYIISLSSTVEQIDPLFGVFDNMLNSFVTS